MSSDCKPIEIALDGSGDYPLHMFPEKIQEVLKQPLHTQPMISTATPITYENASCKTIKENFTEEEWDFLLTQITLQDMLSYSYDQLYLLVSKHHSKLTRIEEEKEGDNQKRNRDYVESLVTMDME